MDNTLMHVERTMQAITFQAHSFISFDEVDVFITNCELKTTINTFDGVPYHRLEIDQVPVALISKNVLYVHVTSKIVFGNEIMSLRPLSKLFCAELMRVATMYGMEVKPVYDNVLNVEYRLSGYDMKDWFPDYLIQLARG